MTWTADSMPDLSDRRLVVTGANSGIGLEATRELARAGATVVMACRSRDRGEAAAGEIHADVGHADLVIESLDLASLESIRTFAAELDGTVDVLVNNAGVMGIPRAETEDGFEKQLGINHLGHFALTAQLSDQLAADGRVVTVSSAMHERGAIDFGDLHSRHSYGPWEAYSQSKLANVLFARELQRRFEAAGTDQRSLAVHPGYADTDLQPRVARAKGSRIQLGMMWAANAVFAQPASMGALPTLYAATAPDVNGGGYYGPGGLLNMRGYPDRQEPSKRAQNPETAKRLWDVSEAETGVDFSL
ncbi:oxidoreductase [Halobacteria archaeon AArc-curdl1]|uniref:Oxidoreductase n=1 Tax=Natronosalvus hydrolyticus TaxID=2979988 RepID=A0AAP2Z5P4_9EURY|nr:oxidoreductase [Halobacteria archaeon AArc-curdl1]